MDNLQNDFKKQFDEFDKRRNVQGIDYDKIHGIALACIENKRNHKPITTLSSSSSSSLVYLKKHTPTLLTLIESYPDDRTDELEITLKMLISNLKDVQTGRISQKECTQNILNDQLTHNQLRQEEHPKK